MSNIRLHTHLLVLRCSAYVAWNWTIGQASAGIVAQDWRPLGKASCTNSTDQVLQLVTTCYTIFHNISVGLPNISNMISIWFPYFPLRSPSLSKSIQVLHLARAYLGVVVHRRCGSACHGSPRALQEAPENTEKITHHKSLTNHRYHRNCA